MHYQSWETDRTSDKFLDWLALNCYPHITQLRSYLYCLCHRNDIGIVIYAIKYPTYSAYPDRQNVVICQIFHFNPQLLLI